MWGKGKVLLPGYVALAVAVTAVLINPYSAFALDKKIAGVIEDCSSGDYLGHFWIHYVINYAGTRIQVHSELPEYINSPLKIGDSIEVNAREDEKDPRYLWLDSKDHYIKLVKPSPPPPVQSPTPVKPVPPHPPSPVVYKY